MPTASSPDACGVESPRSGRRAGRESAAEAADASAERGGEAGPAARRTTGSSVRNLTVRTIAPTTHLAFVAARAATEPVSFLQVPSWGGVKAGWIAESIGWFDGAELVGVATVLYRRAPWLERSLAYLPEGPVIDWFGEHGARRRLGAWLDPLAAHARARGAFAIRMGPPVVDRIWSNATIKNGLAAPGVTGFAGLDPDRRDPRARDLTQRLSALGWHRADSDAEGFGSGQPRYHVRLPLDGGDEKCVWDAMSTQWRRNIRVAERAGVTVERRGAESLPQFHRLYLVTAARDGFKPRPLPYFEQMFRAFDGEDPDRVKLYVASLGGEALAAATLVRVGSFAWFGYGASADHAREVRPSNALQWRMIQDCLSQGVKTYDLRGVPGTLDAEDRRSGLLHFKAGTGAHAVEYVGEWDLPLHRAFYRVFRLRSNWR